ncbi:MAG: hypothetical protein HY281_13160 [Nitrospirae bacterium]|nr:hypothetical protein [Nitrospirota bacterium]
MLRSNLRNRRYRLALLVLCMFLLTSPATATDYVLGDSLSDAGALGMTYTNPTSVSPWVAGKVWVQDIPRYTSIPVFCNDAKCKLDPQSFYYAHLNGNNYAVGGAGVTFDSPDAKPANNYTDLSSQVSALIHNAGYTVSNASKKDHVFVWIGVNDIIAAAQYKDPTVSLNLVTYASATYIAVVSKLAGACPQCKIYIFSIPDLGKTPRALAQSGTAQQELSDLTAQFNAAIMSLQTGTVQYIDTNPYFITYGYDTRTVCSKGIDPNHVCGGSNNPITDPIATQFADPVHPTTAMHAYLARLLKGLF